MKLFFRILGIAGLLLAGTCLTAAERIPDAPKHYFNDYAGVVSRPVADRLNAQLEQFERESSNQLVVAIYPKMESESSVADYTVRVAQAWRVGQKGRSNGVVLFAFMQEHKLYLQVGYGLEARIPDAIAKRIIEREIVPRFRAHDVDGGMTSAVAAMIAAAKGEHRGTGRTHAESSPSPRMPEPAVFGLVSTFAMLFIVFVVIAVRRSKKPSVFMNPGRRGNTWIDLGGGSSGGLFSGGSFGGGGGGDFSSGGGDFGGGGAGGSW